MHYRISPDALRDLLILAVNSGRGMQQRHIQKVRRPEDAEGPGGWADRQIAAMALALHKDRKPRKPRKQKQTNDAELEEPPGA